MTVTGAGGPDCREMRLLLGVYVVDAIDPAERALVDEHLSECAACRDELAGLAGLPAMLSMVPAADVARLDGTVVRLPEQHEPSPELLNSLLAKVADQRRTRMWKGVAAAAAAAVIAAGGTAVGLGLAGQGASGPVWSAASASNPANHVAAVVDYTRAGSGTEMRIKVNGIAPGTTCQFYVFAGNVRHYAATWTVYPANYGQGPTWYSASAKVAANSVRGFSIVAAGQTLLTVPAG
jgi:hypothetical protein